eukprot:scaffold53419_cov57-Phaeocystis_antarctica.AAC.2
MSPGPTTRTSHPPVRRASPNLSPNPDPNQCVERSKEPGFPTFVPIIHVTKEQPVAEHYGLAQQSVFR